ncbi:gliding motility-associated ABC transporter substrate-binding protein GldG [Sediminibacterium soli]|uniref:gliding motility-associated ABC transporter substrate-binding protein GldG n=1 Tax=Sediminibacterium soli TaxID=2698829 RepID=UPI00137B45BB|nr:gliding motility-associated ABC transporter substrate-binding protein GldG [Sediminibacterium soli]NCI47342.1 gliding motility-associated ABC transporter substrate-binding protein GldG [Sediminibacterium soli]
MQQFRNSKYSIWVLTILVVAVVLLSSLLSYRIDLTAEKRHSVTDATKQLLKNLDTAITIQVFLTGDLPADYKKLSIATRDLLDEFRSLSSNLVRVRFEKPGEDRKTDSAKVLFYDSLARMGVVFEQSQVVSAREEKQTSQLIIPSALVRFRDGQKPIAVDLRSSRKLYRQYDVVNGSAEEDVEATRNAAEALLEYKFASAIDKLTRKYVPTVAYAVGNGEPIDLKVNDLGESLRSEYRLAVFDLKKGYPDPALIDALMIVKPTQPFTDEDKLKIDQYVMHGGNVIWLVDKLHAELDSLMRSQSEYTAFDRGLNIDDILFRYGVRINPDLVQDLNCSKIPIVIGTNPDNSPRMQRIPWPYYPFLASRNSNPISRNLDRVLSIFPSSIDTVKAPGIDKTVLLTTDSNSRRLSSPAIVSLNSVKGEEDLARFNKSYLPVAVLLEGKFRSLFASRLGQQVLDSVQRVTGKAYLPAAEKPGKQIVVSDADIITNTVSSTAGPLPMGTLPLENYRFANREFFLNSMDYLVSDNRLFESRNKDFVLRLLDKRKVADQRSFWQFVNIVLPIFLLVCIGVLLQWHRRRKYGTGVNRRTDEQGARNN